MTFEKFYSIVPEFFRQYPEEKALKLLVQNYEHQREMLNHKDEHIQDLIEENEQLKRERSQLYQKLHAQTLICTN